VARTGREWLFPGLVLAVFALIVGLPVLVNTLTAPSEAEPATLVPPGRPAAFHVAPGGSDANPGTLESPWGTLARALEALRPGDTLYVRTGVYRERIQTPNIAPARPDQPITVTAFPGDRAVIQGLLWMEGADYWTFDGINVTWDAATGESGEHMVKFTNGVGWSFMNGELWGAQSYAALLVASSAEREPSDWLIRGNCIHDTRPSNDTNQDHLIYVNSGLSETGGVIEHNLLFSAPNGSGVKLGGPSSDSGGPRDVTVRYNTIYQTGQPILVAWQAGGNTIENNLLVEATADENYRVLRGYGLQDESNVASNNAYYDADERRAILNRPGPSTLLDGGGNIEIDPLFEFTSDCAGFVPTVPEASEYGHLVGSDYFLRAGSGG
jgi:hypothetical protein